MIKRKKLFFYSNEHVSYVEAKRYRLKVSVTIAFLTIVSLFALGFVNNSYGDFLGLGFKTTNELTTENAILKQQIKDMNQRMNNYYTSMNSLAQSDNQLRSIVNLPKIDLETRQLGTGGTAIESFGGLISKDADDLISSSRQMLIKLDKEVEFQRSSYEQIYKPWSAWQPRWRSHPSFCRCLRRGHSERNWRS